MVIMRNEDYIAFVSMHKTLLEEAMAFSTELQRARADILALCEILPENGDDVSGEDVAAVLQSIVSVSLAEKKLMEKVIGNGQKIVAIDKKIKKV